MIVPVLAGAVLLGIAFDMRQGTSNSVDVFDKEDIEKNLVIINKTFTKSKYQVVYSSSEVTDILHVDGDISLKVMHGQFSVEGAGDYFKKVINREKTIELLITCDFESQTETFPSYVKEAVKKDGTSWRNIRNDDVGTHYIRSITYGGQLIVSYQLQAIHSEYMEDILATVNANLALSSGSLSGDIKGNLEKLEKDIQDKATINIKVISTTGERMDVVTSIEQVFELVDNYPDMVKNASGGRGSALRIELVDLSTLRKDMNSYTKNYALDLMLKSAMNKYDDLRAANDLFNTWKRSAEYWTEDQLKLANKYNERLYEVKEKFDLSILALDPTNGTDQFDEAFEMYGKDGDNIPNRFTRDLDRLIHIVEGKPFLWYPYTKSVSHYIHWGGQTCSSPSPEPVYIGYAASSPTGFGSGGNFLCLPKGDSMVNTGEMDSNTVVSEITGVGYDSTITTGSGQVNCAYCRLENATSIVTVPGRIDCPSSFKLEYSGYLMAAPEAGSERRLVCLDKEPDNAGEPGPLSDDAASVLLSVWMECETCEKGETNRYIGCVVCSR